MSPRKPRSKAAEIAIRHGVPRVVLLYSRTRGGFFDSNVFWMIVCLADAVPQAPRYLPAGTDSPPRLDSISGTPPIATQPITALPMASASRTTMP